jgi:multidrug resistance efflux pump
VIAFLTLCYVGILAVLVKLKVIRLTLWWKLSPVAWLLLLIIVLFIPMQWGAPSGTVTMYQHVVEIIPNVSGEVVEVPAQPLISMKKGDVLFKIDPRPYQYALDQRKAALAEAEQVVPQLKAAWDAARAAAEESKATRDRAKTVYERYKQGYDKGRGAFTELEVINRRQAYLAAQAGVVRALATQEQARLAYQSEIGGVNTTVARLQAEVRSAEYDLDQTTVTAPSEGFVVGLTLLPGQRVTSAPLRSWVAYVDRAQSKLVVGISQNQLRFVKPGQKTEVVLNLYPGRTFSATVDSIAYITPQGQLQPSGLVPAAPTGQQPAAPFGVILGLKGGELDARRIPGGAVGTAAIYTDSVRMTHLIRRVMIRMETWLSYVTPS